MSKQEKLHKHWVKLLKAEVQHNAEKVKKHYTKIIKLLLKMKK